MPENHGIVLVVIIGGKHVEWCRRFLAGIADISDDCWSERLHILDSSKNIQISAFRYAAPEQRRVKICRSAVAVQWQIQFSLL